MGLSPPPPPPTPEARASQDRSGLLCERPQSCSDSLRPQLKSRARPVPLSRSGASVRFRRAASKPGTHLAGGGASPSPAAAPQEPALPARPRRRARAEPDACKHQRGTDTRRTDADASRRRGLHPVSRGPQTGLHPSQGTSRTSQACHTEQSVTRKASAWGPPASGSPPPRAQGRAAVLLARGGTSETVPSPPWGLRGAVADA